MTSESKNKTAANTTAATQPQTTTKQTPAKNEKAQNDNVAEAPKMDKGNGSTPPAGSPAAPEKPNAAAALEKERDEAQNTALKLAEELNATKAALQKATANRPANAREALEKIEELHKLSQIRDQITEKYKEAQALNFATSGVQVQFTDDNGKTFKTGNPDVVGKCFEFILERLRKAQADTEAKILELI